MKERGNSPSVQWLGLGTFIAMVPGSIPGWGTEIPQASWHGQEKEKGKSGMELQLPLKFP